jgi:ABC-2 type transport system permease protein
MTLTYFTLTRIKALFLKESRQLLRDRATFGMLLGIPILQIALFGCAIELAPHSLQIRIIATDPERFVPMQRLLAPYKGSVHISHAESRSAATTDLKRGLALMVIDTDVHPPVIYLDATDPVLATQGELMIDRALRSVSGPVEDDAAAPLFHVNRLYNPELRTQPLMVSGLIGVILTMSLVMMSALTISREQERGTLDGLLATHARPLELWAGKLAPYALLGIIQAGLVLLIARFVFHISPAGSVLLLGVGTLVFATANLALGFLFSCVARQQMQAMQMTFFFFLPSSLLSGFMFPFSAMPLWAQRLAETLPLTHYLRIVRGIVLRDVDTTFVLEELVPIGIFAACATGASLLVWRRTIA